MLSLEEVRTRLDNLLLIEPVWNRNILNMFRLER